MNAKLALTFFFLVTSLSAQQPVAKSFFQVPQLDVSTRYRYMDNQAGVVTSDDLQYKFSGRFRLNLHPTGTYIGSRVETGSNFVSSWSNTGIGKAPAEWVLNVKTFFIGQRLGEHAEVEVGAMDFEQGAGTEATYADTDAYTEGYRLRVRDLPWRYGPSKITVHFGYVGDFQTMNSFARMHRLNEINYVQLLAEKAITKAIQASAQYDRLRGLNLLRGGAKLNLPDSWWINDARIDSVVRTNDGATAGWALHLTKTKNTFGSFNPGIYYSHLPTGVFRVGTAQALLNGDIYGTGKRIGFTAKRQLTKEFDLSTLVTRKLDNDPGFRWRAQIVARYQFAGFLKGLP